MLSTARLTLRPHRLEDLDDSFCLWSDPQVVQFIGGRPLTREDVWSRYLRHLGHWQATGFGYFVVHQRERFVGEVGVADYRRDNLNLPGQGEAGWALLPELQGRGYAQEALQGVLDWFQRPTSCIIHPDNQASVKLAEKLNYRLIEQATYKGNPTLVFARG